MNSPQRFLIFNPAINITSVDSNAVLCEVPSASGVVQFTAPGLLIDFLRNFDGRSSLADVFNSYKVRNEALPWSLEKVKILIDDFCIPKGILLGPDNDQRIFAPPRATNKYLYFRLRLFPRHIVYPVARAFGWLFAPWAALALAGVIFATHINFYSHFSRSNLLALGGSDLGIAMLLTIVAAFWHEAGHASALVRHGGTRVEIGLGLYLYMPVLYTDVSEAWKLRKWQRASVDLGGIYFQGMFAALCILTGLFWPSRVLTYTVFLTSLSMAFSMNPFLRMDGYWLVADIFDIKNLRAYSLRVLKFLHSRIFNTDQKTESPFYEMTSGARAALLIYTLFSSMFFIYFVFVVIHQTMYVLLPAYPMLLKTTIHTLAHPIDLVAIPIALGELLWKTTVLAGALFMLWRLITNISRFTIKSIVPTFFQYQQGIEE